MKVKIDPSVWLVRLENRFGEAINLAMVILLFYETSIRRSREQEVVNG